MAFAWRCKRCKGPNPPIKGGPSDKPWIGPCPCCGGSYDGERVSVPDDDNESVEERKEHIQPIVDGELISASDAVANEMAADPRTRGIVTGSPGLDWVMGGDLPLGIGVLLAAPSGCGKSTWLVETLRKISFRGDETIYCSTEESTKQLGRRYARLGKLPHNLRFLHQTDILEIVEILERERPRVAAIDSLHDLEGVVDSNGFQFSTGSGTAVTLAAKMLKRLADEQQITIFAVAHVTKDGNIAGTNTVQHALDATLYMNGKQRTEDGRLVVVGPERTLRCSGKNRFGVTGRVAYLRMLEDGLHDMGPWTRDLPPWDVPTSEREC